MAIDLNACIGCNACLVACQAGEQYPDRGQGSGGARPRDALDSPGSLFHRLARRSAGGRSAGGLHAMRERAVRERLPGGRHHAQPEGLNEMAYNRLRRHALLPNNCPYKVRRFNFLDFHKGLEEVERCVLNPRRYGAHARRYGKVHLLRAAAFRKPRSRPGEGRRPVKDRRSADRLQQTCRPRRSRSETCWTRRAGWLSCAPPTGTTPCWRVERPARTDVPGKAAQSQSGAGLRIWQTWRSNRISRTESAACSGRNLLCDVSRAVSQITERKAPRWWYVRDLDHRIDHRAAGRDAGYLFFTGVGVWGNNSPSAGPGTSRTSCSGSASATPAR